MKKLLLILFLTVTTLNICYAGCDQHTCLVDASGSGCTPNAVGDASHKNNYNCCNGYPNDGANSQAAGCTTFCTDPANAGTAMCQSFAGAPINKGLMLLIIAGFGVGVFMINRQAKLRV